jgi:hypothetical protein
VNSQKKVSCVQTKKKPGAAFLLEVQRNRIANLRFFLYVSVYYHLKMQFLWIFQHFTPFLRSASPYTRKHSTFWTNTHIWWYVFNLVWIFLIKILFIITFIFVFMQKIEKRTKYNTNIKFLDIAINQIEGWESFRLDWKFSFLPVYFHFIVFPQTKLGFFFHAKWLW